MDGGREEENDGGSGGRKNGEKMEWSCEGWEGAESEQQKRARERETNGSEWNNQTQHTMFQQTPAPHQTIQSVLIHLFTFRFSHKEAYMEVQELKNKNVVGAKKVFMHFRLSQRG